MENISVRGVSQPIEVFRVFIDEIENYNSRIRPDQIASENANKLAQDLHRLRGSAGFMGFMEILENAKLCEHALKINAPELPTMLSDLLADLNDLLAEIKQKIE